MCNSELATRCLLHLLRAPAYLLLLVQALCVLTLKKSAGFSRFALPELIAPARHLHLPATFLHAPSLCHQFRDKLLLLRGDYRCRTNCIISCTRFLFLPILVFGLWEPPDATWNLVSDSDGYHHPCLFTSCSNGSIISRLFHPLCQLIPG